MYRKNMNLKLKTSDGDIFEANSDLLQYSGTLKYMIDVCGVQNTIIPLQRVNSKTLRKVLDWIHHQEEMRRGENVPMETEQTPTLPNDLTVDISPGMLFHLIIAANFLGYEALMEKILKALIDWMEQTPLETLTDSNISERIDSAVECLIPSENQEEIRRKFEPLGRKLEKIAKPICEQIFELLGEKDVIKRFESFDVGDAHAVYNDAKNLMKFLTNELLKNFNTDSLEKTFRENKSDWTGLHSLKTSMTQALKEIDNDLKQGETELDMNDFTKFLDRFKLSRASWTLVEAIQHVFLFLKDLGQNSIVSSMTNSRTLGSILVIGNKILLSEFFNMASQAFGPNLKAPNLLKGLDTLVGSTSFCTCENIPPAQIIKLQTSNGAIFDTNVMFGDCQEIIKILFKVAGLDESGVVPLPYLNQMVFEKILAWTNYYKQTDNTSIYESGLTRWENQYFRVDMRSLFELIFAADYLEIPGLLEAACQAVSVSMIGPTPEEIMNITRLFPDILGEFHNMLERHFYLYT